MMPGVQDGRCDEEQPEDGKHCTADVRLKRDGEGYKRGRTEFDPEMKP
jgi:hypothetical protein